MAGNETFPGFGGKGKGGGEAKAAPTRKKGDRLIGVSLTLWKFTKTRMLLKGGSIGQKEPGGGGARQGSEPQAFGARDTAADSGTPSAVALSPVRKNGQGFAAHFRKSSRRCDGRGRRDGRDGRGRLADRVRPRLPQSSTCRDDVGRRCDWASRGSRRSKLEHGDQNDGDGRRGICPLIASASPATDAGIAGEPM